MSEVKQVQKNFAYQIVYRIITVLMPLITSPILSRALGAEKLGVYTATLAFVSYFLMLSMLGVENHGNRCIAAAQGDAARQRTIFWNIYAVQALAGMLALALYALACLFVPAQRRLISVLQGLWLLSGLLNINWYFFGTEQFRLTVIRSILVKIVTTLLIVLLIRQPGDLNKYVLIMAGDAVLTNLCVWPFFLRQLSFERPQPALMREHITPILILFIPIMAMSIFHTMDKTMLDVLSTETEVGYYYAADKVMSVPLSIIMAANTVMLPRISNEYSKGKMNVIRDMLRKSTEVTIFMACAIGFGIAAVAPVFIPWFFGGGFEPCTRLVYVFVPVLLVKSVGSLVRSQYMIPSQMDRQFTVSVCCGAVANLVCNFLLIRRYQALGAVYGTLAAECTVALLQLFFTRKRIRFPQYIAAQWPYVVGGLVMLVLLRLLEGRLALPPAAKLLCMVAAGGVIYLLCCAAYWLSGGSSYFSDSPQIQKLKAALRIKA